MKAAAEVMGAGAGVISWFDVTQAGACSVVSWRMGRGRIRCGNTRLVRDQHWRVTIVEDACEDTHDISESNRDEVTRNF